MMQWILIGKANTKIDILHILKPIISLEMASMKTKKNLLYMTITKI